MVVQQFLLDEVSPAYTEWLNRVNAFIDHQENIAAGDLNEVRAAASGFNTIILSITAFSVVLSVSSVFWVPSLKKLRM